MSKLRPREGTNYDTGKKLENGGAGVQTYVFLLLIFTLDHGQGTLLQVRHSHSHLLSFPSRSVEESPLNRH